MRGTGRAVRSHTTDGARGSAPGPPTSLMTLCPASLLLPLPAMMQTFSGSAAAPPACSRSLRQGGASERRAVVGLHSATHRPTGRHAPALSCF